MNNGIVRFPRFSLAAAIVALASSAPAAAMPLHPSIHDDIARSRAGVRRYSAEHLRITQRKGITVAEQKRRSQKRRNRLRHKAHLNRSRRR